MPNDNLALLLYGAGGGLEAGIDFVRSQGFNPVAVIDSDLSKQGIRYFELECISFSTAAEKYGKFYVYITAFLPDIKAEIHEYLLRSNIPEERILNTRFEEFRYGCSGLEGTLIVSERIRFCCMAKNYPDYVVDANWRSYEDYYKTYLTSIAEAISMLNDESSQKNHHCFSCPYCEKSYRPKLSEKPLISMLSWGYNGQPCNCRCLYCWFSRENFQYNRDFIENFRLAEFIGYLESLSAFDKEVGTLLSFSGDFFCDPQYEELLPKIAHERFAHELMTTGIIYDPRMSDVLTRHRRSRINVSLDSGTRDTYTHIKGTDAFERVMKNLCQYSKDGVIIEPKYIICKDNQTESDIDGFAACSEKIGAEACKIAYNLEETINEKTIMFASKLAERLSKSGIKVTLLYFEDAIREQIRKYAGLDYDFHMINKFARSKNDE